MKRLSLVLALGLAAMPAYATNGLRMIGFGPVNSSLGGAGAAMGLDSSALMLNPATMSDLESRVDFGAAYFPTTVSYSATNNYLSPPFSSNPALLQLGGLIVNQPNATITSDFPPVPIPNIGLVIPLAKDWRLGLGMAAVAGVGTDYAANLFSSTVQTTYFDFRFPIGVSWQVLDMLSVGATANPSWALMGYSLGTSLGLPPHPVTSSFGIGFTLGAKLKPLPFLAVGAAYELPTWFKPFKYNIGCSNPGGVIPVNAACGPLGLPGGQEELEFNLPWSGTFGVEAELLDGVLMLVGDVQYVAWSTTLGKGQPAFVNGSATFTSQAFPFSTNWSDQWIYKIGAQVKAGDWLKLRAGFNYGKSPVDPNQPLEAIAFPAIAEKHLTLGAGLQVSKSVAINLASVIGFKNTISGTGNLPDLSGFAGLPPGSLPPATLTYSTSVSGYTLEAGLSVAF